MKAISSRQNPLIKQLAKLASSSREVKLTGMTVLDGDHLVKAFSESGGTAAYLVATDPDGLSIENRDLFARVRCDERIIVPEGLFNSLSDLATPSGLLAVIRVPEATPFPEHPESCLLLEGIQDPGNLGTILRTAVAAGIRHVFLSSQCAVVWSPKTLRAGMGAHFHLSLHEDAPLSEIATRTGLTAAATDPRAPTSIYETDLRRSVAWIFGSEGRGISPELLNSAALRLSVPMSGPIESLNVSSTAAICLFEQTRQCRAQNSRQTARTRQ